ncbi:hypothetical protein BKA67DRAFT_286273 [Truncatella angustata]|uniref:Uncharacterized protein n=1 Tax=Truncatella angustata TaxID=152316 RepID=A0A9P8UME4_9PEZI|nr:uncharacterized protein BKA67DRAFT_286273 [Truncatella angustata]KAH6654652.1 hypothetical protein BKA67DRAFT_286273 [Truncatella angustata]
MSEHVVLADCRDKSGILSSQIAYYPNSNRGTPQDVATVATESGQTALWVCDTTVGLFTDTNTQFVAKLGPKVAEGQYAGTGSNGYDSNNGGFRCWQTFEQDYYVYGNTACNMVYNCDHIIAPSSTASAKCASNTASPSSSASPTSSGSSTPALTTGAVIGISVGAGVALLIAIGAAFFIWRRLRSKRRRNPAELPANQSKSSGDPLGMLKKSPVPTPSHGLPNEANTPWHRHGSPRPVYEMDEQGRLEVSGLTPPRELGGSVRAEMPTPESQYYLWYPANENSNTPLDGPPARQS